MPIASIGFRILVSLALLLPTVAFGAPHVSDVIGTWVCASDEMTGSDYFLSSIDRRTYAKDGQFTKESQVTYSMTDGTQIHVETRIEGKWKLTEDFIEILYTSGKFLSSDSPSISIEEGQATMDAGLNRKSWSKARVLEYGERLVMLPFENNTRQAEVMVSCGKA